MKLLYLANNCVSTFLTLPKISRREQKLIPNIIFHIENLEKNLITITQRAQNSQKGKVRFSSLKTCSG
jgi:hypothetical protein